MTITHLREWDSEFFGQMIVQTVSPFAEDSYGDADCVCLLLDLGDMPQIHAAQDRGFELMDVRVTLERLTHRLAHPIATRYAAPDDVGSLAYIARTAHRITRFYTDPRFDNARCDDLYETWIRNSVAGWADRVLVLGEPGQPVGYVTIHLDGDTSSIGLIAVDKTERGQGYGHALIRGAFDYAAEQGAKTMSVVTQGRNVPALRLFQRCGFEIAKMEVWMHRWA